jgi:AraC-like DNA-binding protein
LSEIAGVSKSQLERDFTRVFAMTPLQYQTRLRMEYAKRLIGQQWRLVDIALECGYAEQSAFTRRFSAYFGISPSAERAALNLRAS